MRRMETAGHRRLWEAVLAMALFLGVLQSASCVKFEVKDSAGKPCIMADLSLNFTVDYSNGTKQVKASFELPGSSVTSSNSTCGKEGKEAPLLIIAFGNHSLSINFTQTDAQYKVDELLFTYNLSDTAFFPGSSENGTKEVATNKSEIFAKTNSMYYCTSPHHVILDKVNLTFYAVKLEAYLKKDTYSKNESRCREDESPTSAPTSAHTSAHTSAPAPSPTTAPVKQPDVEEYRVNGSTGTCLLAKVGLQLNFTYFKSDDKMGFKLMNINPKNIGVEGKCLNQSASLILSSKEVFLSFNFTLNTTASKFYLGEVNLSTTIDDAKVPKFNQENGSLLYLQTTQHKSYKCNSKQTFQITGNFSIETYSLQIQAFNIDDNKFGPAVECADDQNGMLVPIVVGAALAGLVLIVLIAYLVGRRRSHAGYQTI